ncbi:MAG: hypothetical protein GY820_35225 [Gammaproteobacteria bacterium]|nr:hypothetical protein [Gammaproteobacteria bacterium]
MNFGGIFTSPALKLRNGDGISLRLTFGLAVIKGGIFLRQRLMLQYLWRNYSSPNLEKAAIIRDSPVHKPRSQIRQ